MIRSLIARLCGIARWRNQGQLTARPPFAHFSARELADLPLPKGIDLG